MSSDSSSPVPSTPSTSSKKRYYCPLGDNGPHETTKAKAHKATKKFITHLRKRGFPQQVEEGNLICHNHYSSVKKTDIPIKVSMPAQVYVNYSSYPAITITIVPNSTP
jgi:hypothetical protein